MISQNITKLIGEAMKAHDEVRLGTLRMLSSEFNYEKIKIQKELEDSDEERVIRREAKKRKDAIESYKSLSLSESVSKRIEQEQKELEILKEFLPPEISEEELNQIISDSIIKVGAKSIQDLGKVIGLVKSKAPSADGSVVAEIVRSKLSN